MFYMKGALRVITLCCLISLGYQSQERNTSQNLKSILLWDRFFDKPASSVFELGGTGHTPFQKLGCPVNNCSVTDSSLEHLDRPFEEYDAVLLHIASIDWSSLPRQRKLHQRYVFYLWESPENVFIPKDYKGYFNWTMTYRRDSDIWMPYGSLISRLSSAKEDPRSVNFHLLQPKFDTSESTVFDLSQKEYLVAWFVSNCITVSGRERYVDKLLKYIPIHIYGFCGNYSCPEENKTACFELLERNYKFYLSFENSICKDYVTEKVFDIIKYNVVPIVYGGANYSEILPPMSYINVADFSGPQDLAHYLLYLDKTPDEYVKYFWWKSYFTFYTPKVMCKLCEMLNDASLPHKVYPDVIEWWQGGNICGLLHRNEMTLSNQILYYCTAGTILFVICLVFLVHYSPFCRALLYSVVDSQ